MSTDLPSEQPSPDVDRSDTTASAATAEPPGPPAQQMVGVLHAVVRAAILIGCLLLPPILTVLAIVTERDAAQAAVDAALAEPTPAAVASSSGRPALLDNRYYFVNACVSAPVGCDSTTPETWGEYYAELERFYNEAVAELPATEQAASFDDWAREHAQFITVHNAADGAYRIEQAITQDLSQGQIHMIGTSAGGASIFSYVSRLMRGDVPQDRRVRSAIAIDSPLGYQYPFQAQDLALGVQAGVMKSDVELGVGEWAQAINLDLFTSDTPNDTVAHETIVLVPEDKDPVYPAETAPPPPAMQECTWNPLCYVSNVLERLSQGSVWHSYTGSHAAEATRQFMEEHWR